MPDPAPLMNTWALGIVQEHVAKIDPKKTYLEIGSRHGGSLRVFGRMMDPGAKLIAVDRPSPPPKDNQGERLGAMADELRRVDGYDVEVIQRYGQVVIGLRETEIGESNPHTVKERREMFREKYRAEIDAGALRIINLKADITHVVHGRAVGWEVVGIDLPAEIEAISATEIRESSAAAAEGEPA